MNLSIANLRRAVPAAAAIVLLSVSWSLPARAQSDTPPATTAADTAVVSAPATGKGGKAPKLKKAKTPKAPKAEKAPKPAPKPYSERRAEDGLYAAGSNWVSLRLGYAKRSGDFAGQGYMGYGMGWQHMLTKRYAFAAGIQHDVVAHFSAQTDIAVPFTMEFQKHFGWKSSARPYVGLGGGYYFRKLYRTVGQYDTEGTGGFHVSVGIQSPLGDRHAIGLEARAARVQRKAGVTNPTFGTTEDSETLWTVKGTWALVY